MSDPDEAAVPAVATNGYTNGFHSSSSSSIEDQHSPSDNGDHNNEDAINGADADAEKDSDETQMSVDDAPEEDAAVAAVAAADEASVEIVAENGIADKEENDNSNHNGAKTDHDIDNKEDSVDDDDVDAGVNDEDATEMLPVDEIEADEEETVEDDNEDDDDEVDDDDEGVDENKDPANADADDAVAVPGAASAAKSRTENTEPSSRLTQLPLSRIKALMKVNADHGLASSEAVFLMCKATELFIESLTKESFVHTAQARKKTVQLKDVERAIESVDALMFLEGALW